MTLNVISFVLIKIVSRSFLTLISTYIYHQDRNLHARHNSDQCTSIEETCFSNIVMLNHLDINVTERPKTLLLFIYLLLLFLFKC